MRRLLHIFLILVFGLVYYGCSSDDDNPTEPGSGENLPEVALESVTVPLTIQNSDDPNVRIAASYIALANSFSAFRAFMIPRDNQSLLKIEKITSEWEYTWMMDGISVTMHVWEDSNYYYWEIILNGSDEYYTYSNFVYMEMRQTLDGSSGYLKGYNEGAGDLGIEWNWSTDASGNYFVELTTYNNNNADMLLEVMNYADGSGYMKLYEPSTVLSYEIAWNSDGAGTYAYYDAAGNVSESGSF